MYVHNQKGAATEQADILSSVLITSTEHCQRSIQVCGKQTLSIAAKMKNTEHQHQIGKALSFLSVLKEVTIVAQRSTQNLCAEKERIHGNIHTLLKNK